MNIYSIVISASNGLWHTKRCLDSIMRFHCTDDFEIIIVNNASMDGTHQYLDDMQSMHRFIRHVENNDKYASAAKARNIGAEVATGESLIFLSNDAVVTDAWDHHLISTLAKHPAAGIVGARCLNAAGTIVSSWVCIGNQGDVTNPFCNMPSSLPLAGTETECSCVGGDCLAIKRNDFFESGKFDERYIDGYENLDICLRFNEMKRKVVYQPASVIFLEVPSRGSRSDRAEEHGALFREKWQNRIKPDEYVMIKRAEEKAVSEQRQFPVRDSGAAVHLSECAVTGNGKYEISGSGIILNKQKTSAPFTVDLPGIKFLKGRYLLLMAEISLDSGDCGISLYHQTGSEPFFSEKKKSTARAGGGKSIVPFVLLADYLSNPLRIVLEPDQGPVILHEISMYYFDRVHHPANPLVSIIIPCYNHGRYLRESVESVEKACPRELCEVIIVNDGSTDPETLDVLREIEGKGHAVLHQPNRKLGAARNNGIRMARGTYILPLDSDNTIRPDYIKRGVEIMEMNPDVGVVYGDSRFFGADDIINIVPEFDPVRHFVQNTIDACALFRKKIWEEVGGYKENMIGYQDWEFWTAVASLKRWRFYHLGSVAFDYRISENSMVTNTRKHHEDIKDQICINHIRFFRECFEDLESRNRELENRHASLSDNYQNLQRLFIKKHKLVYLCRKLGSEVLDLAQRILIKK